MANKKMTKRDYFNRLLMIQEVQDNLDLTAFIEKEKSLLEKKNGATKKPTAKQTENEDIKLSIIEGMQKFTEPMTITELIKNTPELSEMSNQKVSALMHQLLADGAVEKTEIKRRSHFFLV